MLVTVVVLVGGVFFASKMGSSPSSATNNSTPVSDEQKSYLKWYLTIILRAIKKHR